MLSGQAGAEAYEDVAMETLRSCPMRGVVLRLHVGPGKECGVGTECDWSISLQKGHKREQIRFPWEHSVSHHYKVLM